MAAFIFFFLVQSKGEVSAWDVVPLMIVSIAWNKVLNHNIKKKCLLTLTVVNISMRFNDFTTINFLWSNVTHTHYILQVSQQ